MSEAAHSIPVAIARRTPARPEGTLAGATGAVVLILALRDITANGPALAAILIAVTVSVLTRRPLGRIAPALPGGLRARMQRVLHVAARVEAAVAALAAGAMLFDSDHAPLVATGLAGFLAMGAVARLTFHAVLRHALDADDPDDR